MPNVPGSILLIGASRGLGLAIAAEFLNKGWNVTGTVRGEKRTQLHDIADQYKDRADIETLDINDLTQLTALQDRLSGKIFDILFVNAGTTNPDPTQTIAEVSTKDFVDLMITNALSPMRAVESLEQFVSPTGLIGIMSSGQGSIANNKNGLRELYRGTKAALNMFMRSFAARHVGTLRPMVLMAPGWVRTELVGPKGTLSIEESVPNLVNVLLAKREKPGLEYLDYLGRIVPW